jgi:hypothetical protein
MKGMKREGKSGSFSAVAAVYDRRREDECVFFSSAVLDRRYRNAVSAPLTSNRHGK